ncbi:syntaxin-18-like [Halichondria panicea]|uniref:syntaxin-18-like n=1 Tax=Halichondria panicea TaxID=6063 RepID=UPI00312B540F
MDLTQLFLATVKTIRLRLKAQRRSVNDSNILSKSSHKPTQFSQESKDLIMRISKLRDFLLEHRKKYINSIGHLISKPSSMTDSERDQIDNEAQQFIQELSKQVQALHKDVSSVSIGLQCRKHRQAVYESLGNYLKDVCKLYSEQRAIRVKRIVDRKRTARLQLHGHKKPVLAPSPTEVSSGNGDTGTADDDEGSGETNDEAEAPSVTVGIRGANDNDRLVTVNHEADILTEEERTVFAQENEQMFAEMSTLVDEVRQIEGKVIEISKLQEIFAEKVLVQAKQLDIASDLTVTASENVTSGNEQIRQAIKNKASLRLWILFILIMCSFSLLFLHWYS